MDNSLDLTVDKTSFALEVRTVRQFHHAGLQEGRACEKSVEDEHSVWDFRFGAASTRQT